MLSLIAECLDRALQRLDDMSERLARVSPSTALGTLRTELDRLGDRMALAVRHRLTVARHEVLALDELLKALSPQGLLGRGYAFVEDAESNAPIRSVRGLHGGSVVRAHLSDGQFTAAVTSATPHVDSLNHNGEPA
jgi:exodeoxyribonuclease VII large subunit